MQLLEQSAATTIKTGPFVDETDGFTAETGLTISQADVRLSMNGGNMAQKTESSACTHDEIGYYDCPLDTTDTGTLGRLRLMVHEAGARPVMHEFMVVPSNVYDSLVLGTDYLDTEVAAMAAGVVTAAAVATDAIDADALAADALAEINAQVVDVLSVDTWSEEAQGLPPLTPTIKEMFMYMYMTWRNDLVVDSVGDEKQIHNNAGTVICKKPNVGDAAGIYSEDKMVTGP